MLLFVALGTTFLALFLATVTVFGHSRDKQTVRTSLKQLEGYDVGTQRGRELASPLTERVAVPLLRVLTGIGKKVWPPEYVAATKKKLVVAGITGPDVVDRFLAVRIGGLALVPVWWVLVFPVLHLQGKSPFLVGALFSLGSVIGPQAWLNRRIEERQKGIARQLPDILDLLTISVEAGLGFEQALARIIGAVPGELSNEFNRMLGEVRAGVSRADALRALDERTDVAEVRSFVLAILQADTFGVSIGRILRQQADDMRIKRRQAAQERAQKAPVKMLIPMVFCIFPSLFVVVLGPAILNIRQSI